MARVNVEFLGPCNVSVMDLGTQLFFANPLFVMPPETRPRAVQAFRSRSPAFPAPKRSFPWSAKP